MRLGIGGFGVLEARSLLIPDVMGICGVGADVPNAEGLHPLGGLRKGGMSDTPVAACSSAGTPSLLDGFATGAGDFAPITVGA
mmetsp:Transcript_44713/g.97159  ORF Transcript_44713/g.97159 Transcript_44713/m.97159 type:complete len:83 (+) Transcript_44713:163-411(+)